MKKTFEDICEINDEIFECFQEYFPDTPKSEFATKYPLTFQLFMDFEISTTFIKSGIFESTESDNIFAVKILMRSLIEHYLRFKYVFLNWAKDKSEEAAERYFIFSHESDQLNNFKARITEIQLFNPKFKFEKWNEMLTKYSRKEIEDEANKYNYKNIIRFLIKTMKRDEKKEFPFLNNIIIEYSHLSAYVHGGIHGHNEIRKFAQDENLRNNELIRLSSLAAQMQTAIKMFTLICLIQTDRERFSEAYHKISKLNLKFVQ